MKIGRESKMVKKSIVKLRLIRFVLLKFTFFSDSHFNFDTCSLTWPQSTLMMLLNVSAIQLLVKSRLGWQAGGETAKRTLLQSCLPPVNVPYHRGVIFTNESTPVPLAINQSQFLKRDDRTVE
jgi:hypothetical protein